MAVLVSADVPGQTREGYDATLKALEPAIKAAPGFIMHASCAAEGGWQVMEVWESAKDAADFFAKYVRPNLPPGVRPRRVITELHSLVRR